MRFPATFPNDTVGVSWDAWGRFRAVAHRAVWDALRGTTTQ